MKMKKFTLVISLMLVLVIMLTGCGAQSSGDKTRVESGSINTEYAGDPSPVVLKDYKITEQSKQELMAIPVKSGAQEVSETENNSSEEGGAGEGGSSEAKPKI